MFIFVTNLLLNKFSDQLEGSLMAAFFGVNYSNIAHACQNKP